MRGIILILFLASTFSLFGKSSIFDEPSPASFEAIWKKSPFTRQVTPSAPPVTISQYALTGVLEIGDTHYVGVFNKSNSERTTVTEELKNGMRLIEFHYSDNLKEASAIIEVNGLQHTIYYDPALLTAAPAHSPSPQPASAPNPPPPSQASISSVPSLPVVTSPNPATLSPPPSSPVVRIPRPKNRPTSQTP